MGTTNANEVSERDARRSAAARGRYARNAMVQGAAAELFKVWAVTVRARGASLGARIVLCLHDELLVHAPLEQGRRGGAACRSTACTRRPRRWAPDDGGAVRRRRQHDRAVVRRQGVSTVWCQACTTR